MVGGWISLPSFWDFFIRFGFAFLQRVAPNSISQKSANQRRERFFLIIFNHCYHYQNHYHHLHHNNCNHINHRIIFFFFRFKGLKLYHDYPDIEHLHILYHHLHHHNQHLHNHHPHHVLASFASALHWIWFEANAALRQNPRVSNIIQNWLCQNPPV